MELLSDIVVYLKYARYLPELGRRESWDEIVNRVRDMHVTKFPALASDIYDAFEAVRRREVLPSMRSLQFAGRPIELNPLRGYNCAATKIDDPRAFEELAFLLLSGCGVGFSVQRHHVAQLPELRKPRRTRRYLIGDSIEGWSDAFKVLLGAYFDGRARPRFDFGAIRPKGTPLRTAGGVAPGPDPLREALYRIEQLLERIDDGAQLTPLQVHDVCCYIADCVRAGGIRRSAMISLFSVEDEEMLSAKAGRFYEEHPQRQRANNSAVILRHRVQRKDFDCLWQRVHASNSGEPGLFFTNSSEWLTNPCAEISLRPFQLCNLTTVNFASVQNQADLERRVAWASLIGTLQATYTDFHYMREVWRQTTEREALIGVSLNGLARADLQDFDLTAAAEVVKQTNQACAVAVGINEAARCTTVKPDGTSALVLGNSSGIHAWHAPHYLRRIQLAKSEPVYAYLREHAPMLLEDDLQKPERDAFIVIPVAAPTNAPTREEPALALAERVGHVYKTWIVPGHREGQNTHNVSTTISVRPGEWEALGAWVWENRNRFTSMSFLPYDGGVYVQAPFEETTREDYQARVDHLPPLALTGLREEEDHTELQAEAACAGGACEVTTASTDRQLAGQT